MERSESDSAAPAQDRPGSTVRVSVLMPTWQGMEFLPRVMDALKTQRTPFTWDFRAIDSGSSDGTWEYLHEIRESFPVPLFLERIHGVEFDHGDTRNLLAARSRGELMVFLTQDAIPGSDTWLADFVGNFDDPEVGAAYCRNVPRPDADPLTKIFSAGDPGYSEGRREVTLPEASEYEALGPHERRLLYNFNDVASGFRRSLWERHPFPRTPFGEDILMARAFLEAGFKVVYDDAAVVEHSHDYSPEETRSRARIDAEFNAEWLDRICVGSSKDAETLTQRLSAEDGPKIEAVGVAAGMAPADVQALKSKGVELRRAAFQGLFEGGRTQARRPLTRMRASGALRLLYVVHGFPPDTWAGTEIYTYNIAQEMQRRGHEVTILTRSGPASDEPEFTLRREQFQGLSVIRMTHRLDFANLRESYLRTGPEVAFREVLSEVQPDVVHFQHLIHLSAGLVDIAKGRGLATVVTCHDYWGLCARVQMIRPDGAICPSNMGSGCFFCVKDKGLDKVEQAAKLDGSVKAGKIVGRVADLIHKVGFAPQRMQERAQDFVQLQERATIVPNAYASADLRISPSRFLRDMYLAGGDFDPHGFLYSDNGMRTDHVEALAKTPDSEGRMRFGFVGSLVWYKGGKVLVEAIRRLADAGLGHKVHLHVYGGFDPKGDEHHRELEALSEGAPITFHGRFDNSRLSEVYADIDVLVVPSVWYENSPITIHEAYLTKTPVLSSDIGGMAEYVRDEIDGLHFRVGDANDLAAKMRRFVEEPELMAKIEASDWMPIKTLVQNGEEMEARYRSLATIVRTQGSPSGPGADLGGPEVILDCPGTGTSARRGATEDQAGTDLLARPGGGAEWRIPATGKEGEYEICVTLAYLEGETSVVLGGSLAVDGQPIGDLEPRATSGPAETRDFKFAVHLLGGEAALSLDTSLLQPVPSVSLDSLHLRVRRLQVVELRGAPGPSAEPVNLGGNR